MAESAISPTREENYAEWYQEVIKGADLADNSPVRGCMVIKPWGYALWENMQTALDGKFKDTGHVNAYFPLLIPLSFLEKEAQHVEGFAKECAVVTHHRLIAGPDGKLKPDPSSALEEPYIIRPTSETIIGHMCAKWVQSYRDLPLMLNQWCNVMRWEMRTRMFLRTAEFLWQEGHTVHAIPEEAREETLRMLDVYSDFAENYMALPVIKGLKTPDERFPGAVDTYTVEAMMQDRKALQAGTSHFLGQNFAKAAEIQFLNQEGLQEFAWTTSWGVSTRLIGALIMTHSDDNGLVLPPRLAPLHVMILPIYRNDSERESVMAYVRELELEIRAQVFDGRAVRVKVDTRDLRGGEKSWQAIKQGVPLRVEVGPRDIAKGEVFVGRRDQGPKEKASVPRAQFIQSVSQVLTDIQQKLFNKARAFRDENIQRIDSMEDFERFFAADDGVSDSGDSDSDKRATGHGGASRSGLPSGGFALAHWNEAAIGHESLARLKVTPRCIPLQGTNQRDQGSKDSSFIGGEESGQCIFTGKPSAKRVIFAKSY